MAILRPFCAVRPEIKYVASIAALPYDVYDRDEAKAAVKENPLSFLRIDRAETQFPDEVDTYDQIVYDAARDTLAKMCHDGFFIREENPCYYIYALTMQGRTQSGLVGCAAIDDYVNGTIKRHENTLNTKELDRIRHIDTLNAQTGPIFLAYRPHDKLRKLIEEQKQAPPLYDFESEDGIRHQVWQIAKERDISQVCQLMEEIHALYIADGHHRAASAVKVGLKRRRQHPDYDGTEEFNYFLSVLFAADELQILPYNRLVTGSDRYPPKIFLHKLETAFLVEPWFAQASPKQLHDSESLCHPVKKGEIAMYMNQTWYRLRARPDILSGEPVSDLDVSILQNHVLEPLFEIHDPKVDTRISFVGGCQKGDSLMRLANTPPGKILFSMYPTSMEELLSVADAGGLMPPKSTWFEPKLRSGLFIHEI